MKVREGFVVRTVGDKKYAVATGEACKHFKGMRTLNEMGALIFDAMKKDVTVDEIVERILSEYDATKEQVTADVTEFVEQLKAADIITD